MTRDENTEGRDPWGSDKENMLPFSLTFKRFLEFSIEDDRRADLWDELIDERPLRALLNIFHNITVKRASAPHFNASLKNTADWVNSVAANMRQYSTLVQFGGRCTHTLWINNIAGILDGISNNISTDVCTASVLANEYEIVHRIVFEELKANGLESAGRLAFLKHGYDFFQPLGEEPSWQTDWEETSTWDPIELDVYTNWTTRSTKPGMRPVGEKYRIIAGNT